MPPKRSWAARKKSEQTKQARNQATRAIYHATRSATRQAAGEAQQAAAAHDADATAKGPVPYPPRQPSPVRRRARELPELCSESSDSEDEEERGGAQHGSARLHGEQRPRVDADRELPESNTEPSASSIESPDSDNMSVDDKDDEDADGAYLIRRTGVR